MTIRSKSVKLSTKMSKILKLLDLIESKTNFFGTVWFRAVVPNLGYVKYLKGYASSRIAIKFSMKQLTNTHKGVRGFHYFLNGGTRTEKGWEPLV